MVESSNINAGWNIQNGFGSIQLHSAKLQNLWTETGQLVWAYLVAVVQQENSSGVCDSICVCPSGNILTRICLRCVGWQMKRTWGVGIVQQYCTSPPCTVYLQRKSNYFLNAAKAKHIYLIILWKLLQQEKQTMEITFARLFAIWQEDKD